MIEVLFEIEGKNHEKMVPLRSSLLYLCKTVYKIHAICPGVQVIRVF